MKLKNLFLGLGLTLAVGASALIGGISTSKEIRGASAHSTDDLTKITTENSADFIGATAYVIGSNTAYGLSTSGKLANGGTLLALTIEEGTSGNSIVLKRNDNNKYLNDPINGSWADNSYTRFLQTSNGALSRDNDTEHYYRAVKYSGDSTIYYETYSQGAMGTTQSVFYVYAEPLPEPVVLNLKVNDRWASDGARFAAYFYGKGEETTWADMTLVSGSSRLYEVTVPDGYPSVIFCRMDGSKPENNWDNKLNQTGNLSVADGDYYLMYDDSWDAGIWHDGSRNVYVEGDFTDPTWTALDANKLTWNRLSGQYEFKAYNALSKDANFKIVDVTTNTWIGYSYDITNDHSLFTEGTDGNIVCASNTVYDIYYKPQHYSVWIEENQVIAADHFAQAFLDTTSGICVDSSESAGDTDLDALAAVWNAKETPDGSSLVEKWNALSIGAKGTFAEGTATDNIIKANARYVHIMSRYSDKLTPFSDGPAYVASSQYTMNNEFSSNSVALILVIASTALVALAALVVLKKRKAN